MIKNHYHFTESKRAEHILNSWEYEKDNFWKVISGEYKKALLKLAKEKSELAKENEIAEIANGQTYRV